MQEKCLKMLSFSYPKEIPSLLQLGLINPLGTRGVYGKGVVPQWPYNQHGGLEKSPQTHLAPAPQVFNLELNKHLWLVPVGDASWLNFNSSPSQKGSQQGLWKAPRSKDEGYLIHSLVLGLCRPAARRSTVKKKNKTGPQPSVGGETPPDTGK